MIYYIVGIQLRDTRRKVTKQLHDIGLIAQENNIRDQNVITNDVNISMPGIVPIDMFSTPMS